MIVQQLKYQRQTLDFMLVRLKGNGTFFIRIIRINKWYFLYQPSMNPTATNYIGKSFGSSPKNNRFGFLYMNFKTYQSSSFSADKIKSCGRFIEKK